jgi:hypothetical protein
VAGESSPKRPGAILFPPSKRTRKLRHDAKKQTLLGWEQIEMDDPGSTFAGVTLEPESTPQEAVDDTDALVHDPLLPGTRHRQRSSQRAFLDSPAGCE